VAPRADAGNLDDGATFDLERFEWAAPDRLEVAGSFHGIEAPSAAPTLVLYGADGAQRLVGAPVDHGGDGAAWVSEFVWSGPPVPFDDAELELDGGLSIGLPQPGMRDETLEVRTVAAPQAADLLQLQAALIVAQEDAREADAARAQLAQELAHAREDLEAERARHASDAENFKRGLAQVREAGEQALAASSAEVAELRERADRLEAELEHVAALRAELEQSASEAAERERALDDARDEAGRLQSRLDAVRQALDDAQ
jgi:flagellar biosynthesis GTPase FlhF